MATALAPAGSRYELPLLTEQECRFEEASHLASSGLPARLLVANALWFCRLRWIVVAVFAGGGLVSLSPDLLAHVGLQARPGWLLLTAAALAVVNVGFGIHGRRLARAEPPLGADANLWAQIAFDLLVLTTVVHHVGSLETYVPFAYLFHIVLACIFFPRRWSLAVTLLAATLYVGCVAIEEAGALSSAGMVVDAGVRSAIDRLPGLQMLHVGWALVTWGVIWYLTSHLSAALRDRDHRLATTNARLMAVQHERTRHMLHTTHELKAPFAAIHAGVHMLLRGHCGDLPEGMADVLSRVAARCGQLAEEIQQMLQLANLESTAEAPPTARMDIAVTLRWCLEQVDALALERDVVIDEDIRSVVLDGVEEHTRMLFNNLLTNAITYSHQGGRVELQCRPAPNGGGTVTVADKGIGIEPDKLPRVFDAYYRTNEAARHNKHSTGLGLAVVRHVAQAHDIRVVVESCLGVGTTFTVHFPATQVAAAGEGKGGPPWPTC